MPVAPTHHTPLPPAPDPDAPDAWDDDAYPFVEAWEGFGGEMDALADNAYANAVEAAGAAGTAGAAATTATNGAATATTKAGEALGHAQDAEDAADACADLLTQVQNIAAGISFTSTSTTSLTVGTGSKTWTVQEDESYAAGMPIAAVKTGDPTVYMVGICTAYVGDQLTVAVSQKSGSGTVASWNISVGGIPGPQPPLATASEVAALSDQTKAVSAGALGDALAPVDDGTGSGSYSPNITTSGFHIRKANGTSTLAAPTGGKPGQSFYFELVQDATGSRAWSFSLGYKFFGGTPTPSTAANAIDAVAGTIKSVSPFEARCAYLKGAS